MSTSIEWTDRTWNPVRGCSRVSPGCDNCYAMGQAHRFSGPGKPYEGLTTIRRDRVDWAGHAKLIPEMLSEPLRWRKPQRIFVNSMSDLFHESLTDSEIMRVWLVMARARHHTFQVLTKRPKRMLDFLQKWSDVEPYNQDPVMARGPDEVRAKHTSKRALMFAELLSSMGEPPPGCAFPTYDWAEGPRWLPSVLPNVWLGVSVENQEQADKRIPLLLEAPAAVRFISAEPLLGPVNLWLPTRIGSMRSDGVPNCNHCCNGDRCDDPTHGDRARCKFCRGTGAAIKLDWVIVGSESGRGARPMEQAWAESLRDQCSAAGVAFFTKQIANEHDRKGGKPEFWPGGPWPREFPNAS